MQIMTYIQKNKTNSHVDRYVGKICATMDRLGLESPPEVGAANSS